MDDKWHQIRQLALCAVHLVPTFVPRLNTTVAYGKHAKSSNMAVSRVWPSKNYVHSCCSVQRPIRDWARSHLAWDINLATRKTETTGDNFLAICRKISTYDLEGLPHLPLNLKFISINGVRTLMLPCVSLIGQSERPSGPPRDKVPKAKTSHPDYQAMSSPRGRELAHDYQPHASVTLTTWLRFYL